MRPLPTALRVASLVLGAALVLSSCAPETDPDAPSLINEPAETSAPLVIEPLDAIEGSTTYTNDGVTLLVPPGYEATTSSPDGIVTTEFRSEGAARPALTLTIGAASAAEDGDVYLSARVTEAQLTGEGASDVLLSPAELEGWPTAYAVQATTDHGDEGGVVDLVAVTTRDEDGSLLLTATAEAPTGTYDGSAGDQMLRTLRPAP